MLHMGMGTYTGAGALGGILCWPLVRLLDVAGTWVLLSACTLAALVALTSLSLRRVGEQARDRIQTRVHVQAERQAERREQRKRFEHEPAKLVDLSAPGEPPLGWEERYRIEKKEAEPAPGPELLEPVQAPAAEPEWQEPSIQGENPAYSEEPVLDAPRPVVVSPNQNLSWNLSRNRRRRSRPSRWTSPISGRRRLTA